VRGPGGGRGNPGRGMRGGRLRRAGDQPDQPGSTVDGITYPPGPDELVLRMEFTGGFAPLRWLLARYPTFSLYGDGRAVTERARAEIYPGPALPNLPQRQLGEKGVQRVLELVKKAGLLGPDASYDDPGIADATTTVFTVHANGARHVVKVYALGEDSSSPRIRQAERRIRQWLLAFSRLLFDLRKALPEGTVGDLQEYPPAGLRMFIEDGDPTAGSGLHEPSIAWPLSTPLSELGDPASSQDVRCTLVQGDDLAKLLPDAKRATEITPRTSGGRIYTLSFRPLLPDEAGCTGPIQ